MFTPFIFSEFFLAFSTVLCISFSTMFAYLLNLEMFSSFVNFEKRLYAFCGDFSK